jgi:fermentation-respiration switch protein FrsA (DUF1100 family)
MNKLLKIILITIAALLLILFAGLAIVTRGEAMNAIRLPLENRDPLEVTLADFDLAYEDVTVTTADGLQLAGWYLPSTNGANIIAQHGYGGDRGDLVYEAAFLHNSGYGVLLSSCRAHDQNEGELVTFSYYETLDMEAWHQYLLSRDDVDPARIGILGESMGGAISIRYTAQNEGIRALATTSAFALTERTVETMVQYKVDPPTWITPIIADFMLFWIEREWGFSADALDTEASISTISPRPVLIMQGGKDDHINVDNGQLLYEAAGEPKQLWFVPEAGHVNLELFRPDEYQDQVLTFFDQHLLSG